MSIYQFSLYWKYFHRTLKVTPWIPLVISFVGSPLKSNPVIPSVLSTLWMASWQVIFSFEVCLIVLTTRIELDTVSDTMVPQKPIKAFLNKALRVSVLKLYLGRQWSKQLQVTNHGQCPAMVAKAEAMAPWQKVAIPLALYFWSSILRPSAPLTCFEVFQASIGMVINRQQPAQKDAREVLTKMGRLSALGLLLKRVSAKRLAAVSPNLEIGPIIRAGVTPRQKRAMPPSAQSFFNVGRKRPPFLNWQFIVVLIHIRLRTWMIMAEAPEMPDFRDFFMISDAFGGGEASRVTTMGLAGSTLVTSEGFVIYCNQENNFISFFLTFPYIQRINFWSFFQILSSLIYEISQSMNFQILLQLQCK